MSDIAPLLMITFTLGVFVALGGLLIGSWKMAGLGGMMIGLAWLLLAALDRVAESREVSES